MTDYCNDVGKPGCKTVADPDWVMRFDELGQPPIHWCSACGPEAHKINELLVKALTEDPGFHEDLEAAINRAERNRSRH